MIPKLIKTKEGDAFDPRLELTVDYRKFYEDESGAVNMHSVVIQDRKRRTVYLVSHFDTKEEATKYRAKIIRAVNRARKEAEAG